MQKVIKKLEAALHELQQKIQQREDYVLNRSERWQESEKCEKYEDLTYQYQEVADEIDNVLDTLQNME